MKTIGRAGRLLYGISIIAIALQHFFYADIRPVFVPPAWPSWIHSLSIWAYLTGFALVVAGSFIIAGRHLKSISFYLGAFLLCMLIVFHVPFLLFINIYSPAHLGLWTDPLKELALAGGAFVISGSTRVGVADKENAFFPGLSRHCLFAGIMFFCITMASFGIDHFLYTGTVVAMVPAWVHDPLFWTYLAGVALIGAGIAIILQIKVKAITLLLGVMLLLWCILLHIPRAVADPFAGNGNEITSAFEALAFSGIAFIIAADASPDTV